MSRIKNSLYLFLVIATVFSCTVIYSVQRNKIEKTQILKISMYNLYCIMSIAACGVNRRIIRWSMTVMYLIFYLSGGTLCIIYPLLIIDIHSAHRAYIGWLKFLHIHFGISCYIYSLGNSASLFLVYYLLGGTLCKPYF
jgi:hypothetical protein